MKSFLDIFDLNKDEIINIFENTKKFKKGLKTSQILNDKFIGLIFSKPSTRTRVSFEVGIRELKGNPIFLQENSLQLSRGEDPKDTARTLQRYIDGAVIRTSSHSFLEEFNNYFRKPVINALSDKTHPCQALSDGFTLYETFKDITSIKVVYIGDGNNMCNSLIGLCAILDINFTAITPEKYSPNNFYISKALELKNKADIKIIHSIDEKELKEANVIYTDVWFSMGQEKDEQKLNSLKPFQVNEDLMKLCNKDIKVMHCLPAKKGEEITEAVFEEHSNFIFNQAENRLHTQKALLEHIFLT